jgi:glycosyltransferase involved in cell wall biosynthesis
MIDVSIIIPTYNRRSFVSEAIRSVLEQTYESVELIVVDDGSTDDTAKYVESLSADIQLIQQRNRGPSAARNAGIRAASGKFIAFLDSDDRWLPHKLAIQMNYMQANPDAVVCYTDEIWIRNGRRVNQKLRHRKYSGWIFNFCVPLCIVSPSSVLMHRLFFESVGLFDEELPSCEDYDLWLRASLLMPFHFIAEPLIEKYGGHEDQLSSRWGMDRYRIKAILKLLLDSEKINSEQTDLLKKTVQTKCDILINGFRKRGKTEEAEIYENIRRCVEDRPSLQKVFTLLHDS